VHMNLGCLAVQHQGIHAVESLHMVHPFISITQ
jgi:hypothetical protein